MSAMVESALTAMPRACRASRISFSVIPGLLVAIVRSVAACGSRIGRRWPPILAGAVLPVWRTHCISLIAADALTANRSAAARAELPASTACAIRSRKSCDIGAVMPGLSQRQPPTPGIRTFDSVQARTAIAGAGTTRPRTAEHVGAEENQVDDQKEAVHGENGNRVEAPLQRDRRGQHRRD